MATVDFTNVYIYINNDYNTRDSSIILSQNENVSLMGFIDNNGPSSIASLKCYLMRDNYCVSGAISVTDVSGLQKGWATNFVANGKTLINGVQPGVGTNIFTYMNTNSVRSLTFNKVRMEVTFSNNTTFQSTVTISNAKTPVVIDARKKPVISKIAFNRCDENKELNDEGSHVLSTIKTSFASNSYSTSLKMVLTQYNKDQNGTFVSSVTINAGDSRLSQVYNGINNSDMFFNSFSFSKYINYYITVELGDEYEKSVVTYNVPAAFVNVHLSSCPTGGVAFGKFSASTEQNTIFECNYKAVLYSQLDVKGTAYHSAPIVCSDYIVTKGSFYVRNANDADMLVVSSTNGDTSVAGDLRVSKSISASAASTTGDLTVGGKSKLNGNTEIYGTGYVSSDLTVNENLTVNGSINTIGGLDMHWQDLPLFSGIVSPGSYGGGKLKIGYVGKHVYITGSFNAAMGASIASIPSFLTPPYRTNGTGENFYSLRPCSGGRIARVYVSPGTSNGLLVLEWVKDISDGSNYNSAVWVDCNFDYWLI